MDKTCDNCANKAEECKNYEAIEKPPEFVVISFNEIPEEILFRPWPCYMKRGKDIHAAFIDSQEALMLAEILTAYYAGKIITINRVISAPYSGMHYIDEKSFQKDADK